MRNSVLPMVVVLAVVLGGGCGPGEKAAAPEGGNTDEDLVKIWRELPKVGVDNMDKATAVMIAQKLAESGPSALLPLLDTMGDPAGDPAAKVLAVMSLTPVLASRAEAGEALAPRLMELTGKEHETTTRTCATLLLGMLDRPEVLGRLEALLQDEERRVRMEAAITLVMRQDAGILERIAGIYRDPETNWRERSQLVNSLPDSFVATHLDLFAEAVADTELEQPSRLRAATVLGRLGDGSVVEALRKCAAEDSDADVREVAASALAAVEARAAGGAAAAVAEPAADVGSPPQEAPAADAPQAPGA